MLSTLIFPDQAYGRALTANAPEKGAMGTAEAPGISRRDFDMKATTSRSK